MSPRSVLANNMSWANITTKANLDARETVAQGQVNAQHNHGWVLNQQTGRLEDLTVAVAPGQPHVSNVFGVTA